MVDRTFNVSANDPEKQKRERQKSEAEQARRAERVSDNIKKREINTMMNKRDNAHEVAKSRDEQRIQDRVDEEIQKRVQPKPQKHLRPPGMGGDTREQQTARIRDTIRKNMGESTENRREAERAVSNRKIDKTIDRALSEQSPKKEPSKTREAWQRSNSPEPGRKP